MTRTVEYKRVVVTGVGVVSAVGIGKARSSTLCWRGVRGSA